jgi:hypothetical protein
LEAVRSQRYAIMGRQRDQGVSWKTTELAKLRSLWPLGRSELMRAFPNRTWIAIMAAAGKHGLRRPKKPATCPNELREAVRRRAREDGIPLVKLGTETGCGTYYFSSSVTKTADLNKIARAVEFFGGRIVIDWQDE